MIRKLTRNSIVFSIMIALNACGSNSALNTPVMPVNNLQPTVNQESFFSKIPDYPKVHPKYFNKKYPVAVIAHRGYSDAAPENTIAAIRKAIQVGADMVELDVGLSRDGHVVIMHDDDVSRTTDGKGLVEDMTLEQLKKLDAGSWFNPAFKGEQIPTIDEALEFARGKISVNIEIKKYAVEKRSQIGIEKKVIDALERHGMVEYSIISSFSETAVMRAKQINPAVPTALLLVSDGLFSSQARKAEKVKADAVNEHQLFVRGGEIKKTQKYGLQVNSYTVDNPAKMASMINDGINGLITNRPDLALRLLEEKFPSNNLRLVTSNR